MRHHKVLRTPSAQSLCTFCALRLSAPVAPARSPAPTTRRRLLHTSRRLHQSAAAQASASPSESAGQPQWTFDPNSSLTRAEQEWRAKRVRLRQEHEESEQHARRKQERREQERLIEELKQREGSAQRRAQQAGKKAQRESDAATHSARAAVDRPIWRAQHGRQTPTAQQSDRRQARTQDFRSVNRNRSESIKDRTQHAKAQDGRDGRHQAGDARPRLQKASMPSFGGNEPQEEWSTGWGRGNLEVKPLQYKTEEQIQEERTAQEAKERELKQARIDEARQQAGHRLRQQRDRTLAMGAAGRPAVRNGDRGRQVQGDLPRGGSVDPPLTEESQYRAIPFKATDYPPSTTAVGPQENEWQHLDPRKPQPSITQPSPQRFRPPTETQQSSLVVDDAPAIDQRFQEHKRQRDVSAKDFFTNTNIKDAPSAEFVDRPTHKPLRCARCLEPGHHARDCRGPMRAKCNRCGQVGHAARDCRTKVADGQTNGRQQGPTSPEPSARNTATRNPGNLFRRTQSDAPAEITETTRQVEKAAGRPKDRSTWSFAPQVFDGDARVAAVGRRAAAGAQKVIQQDNNVVDSGSGSSRGWANLEEPEENASDRRNRRSLRGFADRDEGTDDTPVAKSFERYKEGRFTRRRESEQDADDEALAAREERAARKVAKRAQEKAEQEKKKAERAAGQRAGGGTQVHLPEFVSVSNLAQQLGLGYEPFVRRLEQLGYDDVFPGKILNREISGMIAMEYDFDPTYDSPASSGSKTEDEERDLKPAPEVEDQEFLSTRPPVVTIMGHVDHGKTTLLDYLRRTSVAAGEAGGITQHIGAFSVPLSASGKTVTFLDTPGHAAFMSMRQRGANVTDIVILVVAADDSVKPQTLESIRCAKEAGVPMIVAVNKVDKPEADVQRVKNDLARHGVDIEDFGGEVQVVEVSGKTGQGLDALEENVVTLSEILDQRSDTQGPVEGWVLEATTKRAGRVATVLVRRGTLRPGAILVAGSTWARVRTLRDERNQPVMEVGPGMPVEIDGWREQPVAGDEVLQAPGEQKATDVVAYRLEKGERVKMEEDMEVINESRRAEQERRKAIERASAAAAASASPEGVTTDVPTTAPEPEREQSTGQQTIPFIIKADVSGSAEAVAAYIPSLTTPLIAPSILAATVGQINESDVDLASAAQGHIVAFNLPKNEDMRGLAESKGVQVLENDIIYRTLEQVREVLEDKLPPVVTQKVLGEADVGQVFEIGVGGRKKVRIAGCKVRNGAVAKHARVRVLRDGEKVYDGLVTSLKNVKRDVSEMKKGTECGMGFDGWEGFQEGDRIQMYEENSEKRRL